METVIRVVLMFFLIQFLVVLTLLIVALLLARPEVPLWDRKLGHDPLRRSFTSVIHLLSRLGRWLWRLLHSLHPLHGAH